MTEKRPVLRFIKNETTTPDEDNRLFGLREDWHLNACLNFSHDGWDLYAQGYRRAAQRLCESILESDGDDIDSLVYPVLFLYRHHFELRLKHLVFSSRALIGQPVEMPANHRIVDLWSIVEENLAIAAPDLNREDLSIVDRIIKELQTLDPLATAFRYPTDLQGDISLPGVMHINLARVHEELAAVAEYLDDVFWMIVGFLDLKDESEYRCQW